MSNDFGAVQVVPPFHDSSTQRLFVPPLLFMPASARTWIPSTEVTPRRDAEREVPEPVAVLARVRAARAVVRPGRRVRRGRGVVGAGVAGVQFVAVAVAARVRGVRGGRARLEAAGRLPAERDRRLVAVDAPPVLERRAQDVVVRAGAGRVGRGGRRPRRDGLDERVAAAAGRAPEDLVARGVGVAAGGPGERRRRRSGRGEGRRRGERVGRERDRRRVLVGEPGQRHRRGRRTADHEDGGDRDGGEMAARGGWHVSRRAESARSCAPACH